MERPERAVRCPVSEEKGSEGVCRSKSAFNEEFSVGEGEGSVGMGCGVTVGDVE